MSLLFYHFLLKRQDKHVIYLGVNVPENDLSAIIKSTNPQALVTSLVRSNDVEKIRAYFSRLKTFDLPIYGGGWFLEHTQLIKDGSVTPIQKLLSV